MARPATKSNVVVANKHDKCLRLRREGYTLDEIAEEVGYASRSGAYKAIMSALDKIRVPNVENLRKAQNLEIETMRGRISKLTRDILSKKTVSTQEAHLLARLNHELIRLQNREAKLNGMDAPVDVHITTEEKLTGFDVVRKGVKSSEDD